MRIPFVQEYWIGHTFVHDSNDAAAAGPSTELELRPLVPQDLDEIKRSADSRLRSRTAPPTDCVTRFGAWMAGRMAGVCTFVFGDEYDGYYSLTSGEAELTDIFTTEECRGKGIATTLIRYGTDAMHQRGFSRLYAKVWHNNTASARAFLKCGWSKQCFFVRVQVAGRGRPLYVQWPPPAAAAARACGGNA